MMIILVKRRSWMTAGIVLLLCSFASAQALEPAPTFRFLNSGYGAAALGMGGAFTAVANDLTAIYWNPAGVARIDGMQFAVDYMFLDDSDEDFAGEIFPNRFESAQRFALKGNQFRQFSASYTFKSGKTGQYRFAPFVAWQRTSLSAPERELKEPAGVVDFLTPRVFIQSEGTFTEEINGGEDEWSVGMAAQAADNVLIGGSLVFLTGSPETHLTGTFHESFVSETGTERSDLTADQTTTEDISGAYFRLGLLFFPDGPFRLGGTVRFPYERTADITVQRNDILTVSGVQTPVSQTATATATIDVPMEFSAGIAVQRSGALVAASMTYAGWTESRQEVSDSSNTGLIPETDLPYPTLRAAAPQNSLLQYRIGSEYSTGKGTGVILRAGYFWDGQPYGTERKYFTGYSIGVGYGTRSFRADAAYVSESGDVRLTPFSSGDSNVTYRRFHFTVSLLSPN